MKPNPFKLPLFSWQANSFHFIPRLSWIAYISYLPNLIELTFSNTQPLKRPTLYVYQFHLTSTPFKISRSANALCLFWFCWSKTSGNSVYKITCINVNVIFFPWLVFLIYVEVLPPQSKRKINAHIYSLYWECFKFLITLIFISYCGIIIVQRKWVSMFSDFMGYIRLKIYVT